LKRIDDQPVWSLVCFFAAREHRQAGLMHALIRAAGEHGHRQGGSIAEAYPTVLKGPQAPPTSSFTGTPEAFAKAGFVECAAPSASKGITRYTMPSKT
jgi:hypothetical protein